MQPDADAFTWTAIVPVKGLADAKSRLTDLPVDTAELALAFLTDVLVAVAGSPQIVETIVVTGDHRVAETAHALGTRVVDDAGHRGINPAVRWAAGQRDRTGGVLALVSDLPSLTSRCLGRVLVAAAHHRTSFVADAAGTGTTMWLDRTGVHVDPHFGPQSRAAHVAHGATDLVALDPGSAGILLRARLDVDTAADLDRVRQAGVGAASARILAALAAPRPVTVVRLEPGTVVVVGEDGRATRVSADALRAAGWRELRLGQRLDVTHRCPGLSITAPGEGPHA